MAVRKATGRAADKAIATRLNGEQLAGRLNKQDSFNPRILQTEKISRRFALQAATAALIAELAFGSEVRR